MQLCDITNKEFNRLAEYVKNNYGINLSEKKKALVVGRLQATLAEKKCKNFTEYFDYVISDVTGEAITTLINKITTNHTFFMRESEHFNFFKNKILPYLVISQKHTKDLRIWSAGCSSGEEPYTLAMIIKDFLGEEKFMWDTKILATDISSRVIQIAQKGIYSNEQIDVMPKEWKNKYFKRYDEKSYVIMDNIKSEIIFRIFNLMNYNLPFKKKFHVIFCRNVMIYFDSATRKQLIDTFYNNTEDGGYLFIGHSESLSRDDTKYKYIMPAVYKKE